MITVWIEATKATVTALREIGLDDVCFVGGVACALYGHSRDPDDVDIVVLNTDLDQEAIKEQLVKRRGFSTTAPKKRSASYRILWYSDGHWGRRIKVDILLPGMMNIPVFDPWFIRTSNQYSLPVAPISVLLLLKLQAWHDHKNARKEFLTEKRHTDAEDLEYLVPLAASKGVWRRDASYPSSLDPAAEMHVREFLGDYPYSGTRSGWVQIGFDVSSRPGIEARAPLRSLDAEAETFSKTFTGALPKSKMRDRLARTGISVSSRAAVEARPSTSTQTLVRHDDKVSKRSPREYQVISYSPTPQMVAPGPRSRERFPDTWDRARVVPPTLQHSGLINHSSREYPVVSYSPTPQMIAPRPRSRERFPETSERGWRAERTLQHSGLINHISSAEARNYGTVARSDYPRVMNHDRDRIYSEDGDCGTCSRCIC